MTPAEGPAPAALPRADVLGIPLALSDYDAVLDWIDATVATGGRATVSAAAVHLVMLAREDAEIRRAVLATTLVVPDGQPLVWALHALGHPQATRVYGPELMARHCARAARSGTPIYLFGGRDEGALVALTMALRERFPGIEIAGAHATPFTPSTPERDESDARRIDASGAQVVWVGTGQPRQELWMARMHARLRAPVLLGVGAAFDFHAGLVRQAPAWMGRHGLEWAFRLSREPRRLWRRYARHNPRFVAALAGQLVRERPSRRERSRSR